MVFYLFGDDPIFGKFLFETVFGLILLDKYSWAEVLTKQANKRH